MEKYSTSFLDRFFENADRIKIKASDLARKSLNAAMIATVLVSASTHAHAASQLDIDISGGSLAAYEQLMTSEGMAERSGMPVYLVNDKDTDPELAKNTLSHVIQTYAAHSDHIEQISNNLSYAVNNNISFSMTSQDKDNPGCVVNVREIKDVRDDAMVPLGGKIDQDQIENVPGSAKQWRALFALHELGHCVESAKPDGAGLHSHEDILSHEVSSDDYALKSYQKIFTEDKDLEVPKAFVALRNINAMKNAVLKQYTDKVDFKHATGSYIKESGQVSAHDPHETTDALNNLGKEILKQQDGKLFDPFSKEGSKIMISSLQKALGSKDGKLSLIEAKIAKEYIDSWQTISPKMTSQALGQSKNVDLER